MIDEETDERYRSKKTFKILTIRLDAGTTYQFDYVSQEFFAYFYLEDSDGNILDKNNSGGKGKNARIVHRSAQNGVHRIIATSQDGYKTGAFTLSVRILEVRSGANFR